MLSSSAQQHPRPWLSVAMLMCSWLSYSLVWLLVQGLRLRGEQAQGCTQNAAGGELPPQRLPRLTQKFHITPPPICLVCSLNEICAIDGSKPNTSKDKNKPCLWGRGWHSVLLQNTQCAQH